MSQNRSSEHGLAEGMARLIRHAVVLGAVSLLVLAPSACSTNIEDGAAPSAGETSPSNGQPADAGQTGLSGAIGVDGTPGAGEPDSAGSQGNEAEFLTEAEALEVGDDGLDGVVEGKGPEAPDEVLGNEVVSSTLDAAGEPLVGTGDAVQSDESQATLAESLQVYKILDNVKPDRIGLVYDSVYKGPSQPSKRYIIRWRSPTATCATKPGGEPLVYRGDTVLVKGCFQILDPVVSSDYLVYRVLKSGATDHLDSINLLTGARQTVVARPAPAAPIASYVVDGNFIFWSERGATSPAQATVRRTSLVNKATTQLVNFTVNLSPLGDLRVVGADASAVFFTHRWSIAATKAVFDLYRVDRAGGGPKRILIRQPDSVKFYVTDGALVGINDTTKTMFTYPKLGAAFGVTRTVVGYPGTQVCVVCGHLLAGPTGLFASTFNEADRRVLRLDESANRIVEVFRRKREGLSGIISLQLPPRGTSPVQSTAVSPAELLYFVFQSGPSSEFSNDSVLTLYGVRRPSSLSPQ